MFLWYVKVIAITCFVSIASADLKHNPRQGRIFSFELENEDVEVALDFSIPFVKIPIKKTLNAITGFGVNEMKFPNININPMALSLGGLLIVLTTILTPILKKTLGFHNFDRSSRDADDDFNKYSSLDISENLIANSRRCPERIACWASQKSISPVVVETWKQIMRPTDSSSDCRIQYKKISVIIDVSTDANKLLSAIVNTTVLEAATLKGLKGQNCESYAPCPIDENSLPKIIKSFETLTNAKFS